MITIDTWKPRTCDEMHVSIREGDNLLLRTKFRFCALGAENQAELEGFLRELRNYFGFRLELD